MSRRERALPSTPAEIVLDASFRWVELVDPTYPVAVLATAFANWMRGEAVWLLIVAPPSSGKTLFIEPYATMKSVFPLSSLTARTFASGLKGEGDASHSLLEWLKQDQRYILTLKDFGTLLSLSPSERNSILAQLREIYDGRYSAAWGTGERFEWTGKLGLIAAGTPKVDDLHKWSAELGERFVQIRPIAPDPKRVAARKNENTGHEHQMAAELATAHETAFRLARDEWKRDKEVPRDESQPIIGALARLVAEARTPVSRDRYSGGFEVSSPEGPARLTGVFKMLFNAAYILYGRQVDAALDLVRRIAIDSITPHRRHLLLAEASRNEWGFCLDGLNKLLKCDSDTACRYAEDLHAVELLDKEQLIKKVTYKASPKLLEFASEAYLDTLPPAEALKKLFDLRNNAT